MITMFDGLLVNFLRKHVKGGTLRFVLPSGTDESFGDRPAPSVAVRVVDNAALLSLLRDPDLAFGELYMEGRLQVLEGSIYDLLAIAAQSVRNVEPATWILAL